MSRARANRCAAAAWLPRSSWFMREGGGEVRGNTGTAGSWRQVHEDLCPHDSPCRPTPARAWLRARKRAFQPRPAPPQRAAAHVCTSSCRCSCAAEASSSPTRASSAARRPSAAARAAAAVVACVSRSDSAAARREDRSALAASSRPAAPRSAAAAATDAAADASARPAHSCQWCAWGVGMGGSWCGRLGAVCGGCLIACTRAACVAGRWGAARPLQQHPPRPARRRCGPLPVPDGSEVQPEGRLNGRTAWGLAAAPLGASQPKTH